MVFKMRYKNLEVFKDGIWWKAWSVCGPRCRIEYCKAFTRKGLIKKIDKSCELF